MKNTAQTMLDKAQAKLDRLYTSMNKHLDIKLKAEKQLDSIYFNIDAIQSVIRFLKMELEENGN